MKKFRFFQLLACLAIVGFFACGQVALAQDDAQSKIHYHIKVVPRTPGVQGEAISNVAPVANLYPLSAVFTATVFPTDINSDGSDIWPCFGNGLGSGDCPFIGSPQINFPAGGAALGVPSYVWSTTACDQTSGSVPPCGQTETFYEDDTAATTTADLTYTLEVTQGTGTGTKVIADSGTVDFGINPFGGSTPPADVVIFGDQGFGTLGLTGPNNGDCSADFNYPTSSDPAVGVFVIQANKTCVAPVSGLATLTATTEIGTPHYTKHTTVASCGATTPPCWTVTYTSVHKLIQKWTIWLN